MARQVLTEWANGLGFLAVILTDTTPAEAVSFEYANNASRPGLLLAFDKQGRLRRTEVLNPGDSGTFDAGNNWDFDPVTGALNGWHIDSQGPAG